MQHQQGISFRPLYGIKDSEPLCSILEIEGRVILLDCGWTDDFDTSLIEPLRDVCKNVDAVVISFADFDHIGALPYAVSYFGLNAPIYSTIPTYQMGGVLLRDVYASTHSRSSLDRARFATQFVDRAMEMFVKGGLNYRERAELPSSTSSKIPIYVRASPAGRLLGGSVWRIFNEFDNVVYAVDFNHQRDYHLGEPRFDENDLSRASLLITGANNALLENLDSLKQRSNRFKNRVLETLKDGGNVLIPTDSGGRVLELLLLLARLWVHNTHYPLIFAHHRADRAIDFAKRSLEWMHESFANTFDIDRQNDFDTTRGAMQNIKTVTTEKELHDVVLNDTRSPKVVLCTSESMQTGFSRILFRNWCKNHRDLVMFTSRGFADRNTLAYKLQRHITGSQDRIDVGQYESEDLSNNREYKSLIQRVNKIVDSRIAREEKERALMSIDEDVDDDDEEEDKMDRDEDGGNEEDWRSLFVKKIAQRREEQKNQVPLMFSFEPQILHLDSYGLRVHASDFAPPENIEQSTKASSFSRQQQRYYNNMGSKNLIHKNTQEQQQQQNEVVEVFDDDETRKRQKLEMEQDPTMSRYVPNPMLVACQIDFVNMEGRSDGESMRATIENLAPRRVVFVRGNPEENQKMKQFAENRLCRHGGCEKYWISDSQNLYIQLDATTASVAVSVDKSVESDMSLCSLGEYEVGSVCGIILQQRNMKKRKRLTKDSLKNDLIVRRRTEKDDLNLPIRGTLCVRPSVFVRRKPLTIIHLQKQIKKLTGLSSKIYEGTLVVNDTVIIRTKQEGKSYSVEGLVGEDYFSVRKVLYGQYAIL